MVGRFVWFLSFEYPASKSSVSKLEKESKIIFIFKQNIEISTCYHPLYNFSGIASYIYLTHYYDRTPENKIKSKFRK